MAENGQEQRPSLLQLRQQQLKKRQATQHDAVPEVDTGSPSTVMAATEEGMPAAGPKVVGLQPMQVKLTAAEATTLERTHLLTLGEVMIGLPQSTGAREPTTIMARLPRLPLPADDPLALGTLMAMSAGSRALVVRAALGLLAGQHAAGRLVYGQLLHPGTPLLRWCISVGGGRYVTRAAWKKKSGLPRAGRTGPSSTVYVTPLQLDRATGEPTGGRQVFELVDGAFQTRELFLADSLHDAAVRVINDDPRHQLPPSLLQEDRPERHS